MSVLQSVMMIIVLLALYDIFRYILSPLSLRNQRGEYEPGEVYYNLNEAQCKMLLAKKENVNHISTSSATSNHQSSFIPIDTPSTVHSTDSRSPNISTSTFSATTRQSTSSAEGDILCNPSSTAPTDSNIIFKTLDFYLPEISQQRFRGIPLNSILLDDEMIDNDIDLVDWDEMDEKLADEYTADAIQTDEDKDPSHFNIDKARLKKVDNKYINSIKDTNDEKIEVVCCGGNFCGDKVGIKEHREIILCSNNWCNRGNHVLCLLHCSRITDIEFSMHDLLKCVHKKSLFVCPDCILYNKHKTKSLEAVGSIIDSLSHNVFECRINMEDMKESKYYYFNASLNIIELIRSIINYYYSFEDAKITGHGDPALLAIINLFKAGCPALFNIDIGLILNHYHNWKDIIFYHVKEGKLKNCHTLDDFILFRKKCLEFRYYACNDHNIKYQTQTFWILYDCAKSMGCTETLVENVGSTEKIVLNDKKFSMNESKMAKKVILQQHYKGDKIKENQFISTAEPIYRDDIGSVCLKDQNAKTFRKVIKRISQQNKNGPFSLPILFKK